MGSLTEVLQGSVKEMLYGFGDVKNTNPETVKLASLYVGEFMVEMIKDSLAHRISMGAHIAKSKIHEDSLMFSIRNDDRKRRRAEELLQQWNAIKAARAFETDLYRGKKPTWINKSQ